MAGGGRVAGLCRGRPPGPAPLSALRRESARAGSAIRRVNGLCRGRGPACERSLPETLGGLANRSAGGKDLTDRSGGDI